MKVLKSIGFWFLSFTWGIIMTALGLLITVVLIVIGKQPKTFHRYVRIEIGKSWGGFNMGSFIVTSENPTLYTKQHEAGHGIQNIMWGPLMPFVISIPSAIRYWFREQRTQKGKYIFCIILTIIATIIGCSLLIPGIILTNVWLLIIGSLVLAYTICIACWLFIKELPQYKDKNVGYYDIWFEGQASQLGHKYFENDEEKEDN